jgi:hypothetical protein
MSPQAVLLSSLTVLQFPYATALNSRTGGPRDYVTFSLAHPPALDPLTIKKFSQFADPECACVRH